MIPPRPPPAAEKIRVRRSHPSGARDVRGEAVARAFTAAHDLEAFLEGDTTVQRIPSSQARRPVTKVRPRVEALEDRLVPTCTIVTDPNTGSLVVLGDARANGITITDNGNNAPG